MIVYNPKINDSQNIESQETDMELETQFSIWKNIKNSSRTTNW